MSRVVRTVRGDIPVEALGMTLMHEHILCDVTPPELTHEPEAEITPETSFRARYGWTRPVGTHRLTDEATAITELTRYGDCGGHAVVDLTSLGIRPQPRGLARVSRASGIAIVRGCGPYVVAHAATALTEASVDTLAAEMIAALTADEAPAGIIGEIGLSDPWHPAERRALAAAAVASQHTGAAANVHPAREPALALPTVEAFAADGGDPERLVLSHMDRTFADADGPARIADTGATVEWDFFGINDGHYPFAPIDLPHDPLRLDLVRQLIDRGHLTRIAISHDICTKARLTRWGGHGYAHILNNVVPMMRRKGFSDEEVRTLLVETPRRLLGRPA